MEEAVAGKTEYSLPEKYILPPLSSTGTGPVFFHSRIGGVRSGGVLADPRFGTAESGEKLVSAVLDELKEIVVAIAKSEEVKPEERLK
jgi:creatinine amidohydrolase/Fe(II)-dependent formamide hydrolase-like protein